MNLRARRAETGLGSVSTRLPLFPADSVPSPLVLPCYRSSAHRGSMGKGWPPVEPGLARPLPGSRECSWSLGTGDLAVGWWRCGQPEACGGRTLRGTRGSAEQKNGPRSGRPHTTSLWELQAEDRQTDRPVFSLSERA